TPLSIENRLGGLETANDVDQCPVVEGQRALAVGETPEGDEPKEIVRAPRQSARTRTESEFLDNVLDGVQPAHVAAFELKVDGLHGAGNIEHQLDGNALTGNSRLSLPSLRPGHPGDHQAQAQSIKIWQKPLESLG